MSQFRGGSYNDRFRDEFIRLNSVHAGTFYQFHVLNAIRVLCVRCPAECWQEPCTFTLTRMWASAAAVASPATDAGVTTRVSAWACGGFTGSGKWVYLRISREHGLFTTSWTTWQQHGRPRFKRGNLAHILDISGLVD